MRSLTPLRLLPFVSATFLALGCGGDGGTTEVPVIDSGHPDVTIDTGVTDTGSDTFVPTEDASDAAALDAETGPDWPTCDSKPDGTTTSTIPALWATNPTAPVYSWVSGVVVTAVSGGGCAADKACQLFVQQESADTTLAAVAKKAIKVFVSAKAGSRFTGIVPGDKVDVAAHAWRYNVTGQNELLLQVNDALRGCIKKTGTGTITPVPATLPDLATAAAYETQYGPVLVTVSNVTGDTDDALTKIFGLRATASGDAGAPQPVSVSPYCLPGYAFTGMTTLKRYDFNSITGVFGMFIPSTTTDAGTPPKFLVVYPRTMSDLSIQ